jgi:hypothetical protein
MQGARKVNILSLSVGSCGGGVNSIAMFIEMVNRGQRVDRILFADPGAENPETYQAVAKFSKWLVAHDMPPVETVRKTTKKAGRFRGANEVLTIERMCIEQKILPSIAYGYKTCSLKFKREPQDEAIVAWDLAQAAWARGEKVTKIIGYDAGEPQRAIESPDARFVNRYPLIEWGLDREDCVEIILAAGLCVPPKSSCFFCPNMEEEEIFDLRDKHPELLARALALEANAVATVGSSIKGLNREFSWKQILEYDAAQGAFFPRRVKTTPCECYDG